MHETKAKLITEYGLRCMACGQETPLHELQWHHLKPKYVSKVCGEHSDDSVENGSLLCRRCHIEIHRYLWWDDEYQVMTSMIEHHKEQEGEDKCSP